MASKADGKIKRVLGKLKGFKVKTWQLMVILVPLLFIDATLMRLDHIRMTEIRDAVLEADAAEDDEAIEQNLTKLKEFAVSNVVINVVDDNGTQRLHSGRGRFI